MPRLPQAARQHELPVHPEAAVRGEILKSCIFCFLDREVLAESRLSKAFFDAFPVSKGHALIVPKRHVMTIWDATEEEHADAFVLVRRVKELLQERFSPDGFNIGVNAGEAAGQTVWHAHIHLIPRYSGDVADPIGGVRNVLPKRAHRG